MVSIVQIPQRFMVVNSKSPFQAGVRLLPFGAMVPFGSVIAAMLMGRARIAPFYILLSAGVFEIIGTVCLSKMAPHPEIAPAQYGYQVLAGLGVGFFNSALVLLVPHVTEKRDLGEFSKHLVLQMSKADRRSRGKCCHSPVPTSGRDCWSG